MKDKCICYYVAVDGCDQWSGELTRPFCTLKRAIEETRKYKDTEHKRIIIREGSYYDVSVEIKADDSGITIEAISGEKPVFYGGRLITDWKKEANSDFWYSELPEVKTGKWDFRMLSVNGKFSARSRLPEKGRYEHLSKFDVEWLSTSDGGWARKPTYDELTTMNYNPKDLGPWLDIKNAELTIFHKWDESMAGIESHDITTHTFRLSNPCGHPPGAFKYNSYVVWNVREGMTQPGQWYLDRSARKLFYWPMPGENMENIEVVAPTTNIILNITENVKDITIKGLKFSVTNTPLMAASFAAIKMPGALQSLNGMENCLFSDLIIQNTAGHGIKIEGINKFVDIENCEVGNTGAGGIVFYNNMYEVANNNILVVAHYDSDKINKEVSCNITNNYVHNDGLISPSAIAIGSHYCDVSHNEVTNTTYTGISCGGGNVRIEGNIISKAMQVLNDGAAIYVTFCKDGIIFGNVIKDIQQGGESDSTKNAIYLDEQTYNWIVEKNLVINCTQPEFNHMAADNIVRDNIFVSDSYIKMNFIRCKNYKVERNIFYSKGKIMFAGNENAVISCGNNIFYSETDEYEELYINEKYQHYDTMPLNLREGSLKQDPIFESIETQNFDLRSNSPALKLGIKQRRI